MNKYNYLLPILLLGISSSSFAKNDFYIGAGIGAASLSADLPEINSEIKDEPLAWQLFLGKDLGDYFGVEASYTDLGKVDISNMSSSGKVSYKAYGLSGLLYWPSNSNVLSLYGKAGLNYLDAKATGAVDLDVEHEFSLATGVGLRWNISDDWFLRGEYNLYDSDYSGAFIQVGYLWGGDSKKHSIIITEESLLLSQGQSENNMITAIDDENENTLTSIEAVSLNAELTESNLLSPIYFEYNSMFLSLDGKKELESISDQLLLLTSYQVELRGWSDNIGSKKYNMQLSKERAESVKRYLVNKGAKEESIKVLALGESNMREIRDQEKRRVEITIN